ncbi:predicted protein [Arabidopsis lyrata subsp. lyrata]|uniref:Predicted protein n=1 Tax=Arabidopsis lyrata subsp. lyrata TaxID=81972 RepID=D7KYR7_ARALL|nr:predicted protein [Arabidopsis lyrata subsp. lyrata]
MQPAPKVFGKNTDQIKAFAQQFKQQTIRLQGFPLALQLLAYRNISGMAEALTDPSDHRDFVSWSSSKIPKQSTALTIIHSVEQTETLCVDPLVYVSLNQEVFDWDDEVKDKRVDYLLDKVSKGYRFSKREWPGGDCSTNLIGVIKQKASIVKKKPVKPRSKKKTLSVEKNPSSSKRRRSARHSKRFDPLSRDDLVARVECLESELVQIKSAFDLQVQRLSSHADKLEKRFQSMKSQRFRKKSFLAVSARKVLRQTFLPFSKQPADTVTAPVASKSNDEGLSGVDPSTNGTQVKSGGVSGLDNSIQREVLIGNDESGKGNSDKECNTDEFGDTTLGDTDSESSADESSDYDEGESKSHTDEPSKDASSSELNVQVQPQHKDDAPMDIDNTTTDLIDRLLGANNASKPQTVQVDMDIDPPTALVPPGSSPNVHIDNSVVSGDALVPVDNTEDLINYTFGNPHGFTDKDVFETPFAQQVAVWNPSSFFSSIINSNVPIQQDLSASLTSKLTSELDMTLPIFDTSSKQQKDGTGVLPIYGEAKTSSCLILPIISAQQEKKDMMLTICDTSSKQQKEGTEEHPIFDTATKSSCLILPISSSQQEQKDMRLPIFDTTSKQQKEGTEELPIFDTATKSSCLILPISSSQQAMSMLMTTKIIWMEMKIQKRVMAMGTLSR